MTTPNLVNFPKLQEMTISKPTFAPSTPFILHFECLESGPNDSTRVRRLTGIFRLARVKIFIVVYVCFWFQLSEFSSNLTGHHEIKTAKWIRSCRSKYSNFYFKPRLPMTNEDVLNRFRTFRAVKLQPVWSYRCERRLTRPDEHVIKGGKGRASNFRRLWGGIVSLLFVSRTKTRVLRTRDDLCYHCGPFPACVCKVFNHLLV